MCFTGWDKVYFSCPRASHFPFNPLLPSGDKESIPHWGRWANPIKPCFLKKISRGWRNGSADTESLLPLERTKFDCQHPHWMAYHHLLTVAPDELTRAHMHWTHTHINKRSVVKNNNNKKAANRHPSYIHKPRKRMKGNLSLLFIIMVFLQIQLLEPLLFLVSEPSIQPKSN